MLVLASLRIRVDEARYINLPLIFASSSLLCVFVLVSPLHRLAGLALCQLLSDMSDMVVTTVLLNHIRSGIGVKEKVAEIRNFF